MGIFAERPIRQNLICNRDEMGKNFLLVYDSICKWYPVHMPL